MKVSRYLPYSIFSWRISFMIFASLILKASFVLVNIPMPSCLIVSVCLIIFASIVLNDYVDAKFDYKYKAKLLASFVGVRFLYFVIISYLLALITAIYSLCVVGVVALPLFLLIGLGILHAWAHKIKIIGTFLTAILATILVLPAYVAGEKVTILFVSFITLVFLFTFTREIIHDMKMEKFYTSNEHKRRIIYGDTRLVNVLVTYAIFGLAGLTLLLLTFVGPLSLWHFVSFFLLMLSGMYFEFYKRYSKYLFDLGFLFFLFSIILK